MHSGPKSIAVLAFAALWLGALTAARAQESEPADEPASETDEELYLDENVVVDEDETGGEEPDEPGRGVAGVGLDLGFYYRSDHLGTMFDLSPILSGWFAIADDLDITLDWGLAFNSISPEGGESASEFVIGNPLITIQRVLQEGRTRIWFGIGAIAPISSVPDEDEDGYLDKVAAYQTASAIRGNWNHFLWMPEHFGMVLPIGAHMVSEDHILLGGEATFYYLMPIDNYNARRQDFYIQLAGDIGFGWEAVQTGLRLQGVVTTTNPEVDRLQGAIGPFVRYDLGGSHFEARFLLNLDDPNGVFGENDVWGLHLGGGATFQ